MHASLTSLKTIISKTSQNISLVSLNHKRKRFRLLSAEIEYMIKVLEYKWLQRDSNPAPLNSQTNTQPFSQTS